MLTAEAAVRAATDWGYHVDLMTAVRTCLSKYADFSGRGRRSEYWFFYLGIILGAVVLLILSAVAKPFSFLLVIYYLGLLLPLLAAGARRLHDTGKSGWLLLLGLIPLVGGIVLLVFFVTDSTPGPNQYGPNPKEPGYGAPA